MFKNASIKKSPAHSHVSNTEALEILARIQPIFAEVSGVDPEEMDLYSDLEEDLSVNMITDLPKIVKLINASFSISLDPKVVHDEITSVHELIDLIIEETTFG